MYKLLSSLVVLSSLTLGQAIVQRTNCPRTLTPGTIVAVESVQTVANYPIVILACYQLDGTTFIVDNTTNPPTIKLNGSLGGGGGNAGPWISNAGVALLGTAVVVNDGVPHTSQILRTTHGQAFEARTEAAGSGDNYGLNATALGAATRNFANYAYADGANKNYAYYAAAGNVAISTGKLAIGKDDANEAIDVVGNIRATGTVSCSTCGGSFSGSFTDDEVPVGVIDGTNSLFTTANAPLSGTLKVYRNGVRLRLNSDYFSSGTTITFATDHFPQVGDLVVCDYRF